MIVAFFGVVCAAYALLIFRLMAGMDKVKKFGVTDEAPQTGFSIVVPFRNEAKNLPRLLHAIENQDYPRGLFELILVDDASKDNSERVYINWRLAHDDIETTLLENLRLSASPKKDAIARAMPIVKHPWVVTTDADCSMEASWLRSLDQFIRSGKQTQMVAGPVGLTQKNNWFHQFQQFEWLALQGVTMGSFGLGKPFMCNGANFAYTKEFFNRLGGFAGIDKRASGDDVLLLQKAVAKDPDKVQYFLADEFVVRTKPENDLFKLFNQRLRWAGKSTGYQSTFGKMLALVVLATNLCLAASVCLALMGHMLWWAPATLFGIKYTADYLLMRKANHLLRKGKWILPLASSLLYPFFGSLVGLCSLCVGYRWKGRRFKK